MTAVDDARAEAEQLEPTDGLLVPLVTDEGSAELLVPPPGRWKSRANRALNLADFESWASIVLSSEDYEAWSELDPTLDDVNAFFEAWRDLSGESMGKSGNSRDGSTTKIKRKR